MTTIDKIKSAVEQSKNFPNPTIEYNFDELPKDKGITPTSFYGVKALFNNKLSVGNSTITYKLS